MVTTCASCNWAGQLLPAAQIDRRWDQMLDLESKIIQSQPIGARMHSGLS
jgi:hypothetical protein